MPIFWPAGGPDIGTDPGSRRRAGLPRPALPGPRVAAGPRIDAPEVAARWPCEARARAAEGQLPAPALIAASSLALAGREPGRLCNPGLPEHRQLKEETLRGTRNHGPFGRKETLNTHGT